MLGKYHVVPPKKKTFPTFRRYFTEVFLGTKDIFCRRIVHSISSLFDGFHLYRLKETSHLQHGVFIWDSHLVARVEKPCTVLSFPSENSPIWNNQILYHEVVLSWCLVWRLLVETWLLIGCRLCDVTMFLQKMLFYALILRKFQKISVILLIFKCKYPLSTINYKIVKVGRFL